MRMAEGICYVLLCRDDGVASERRVVDFYHVCMVVRAEMVFLTGKTSFV